jgi:hypothetical protein
MSKGNLVSRLEASAPAVKPVMVWRDAHRRVGGRVPFDVPIRLEKSLYSSAHLC